MLCGCCVRRRNRPSPAPSAALRLCSPTMCLSACRCLGRAAAKSLARLLHCCNLVLLLLGLVTLSYGCYLLYAGSWLVNFACGSLILSGTMVFVFSLVYSCGGWRVRGFLLSYITVLFMILVSQASLLVLYRRKSTRVWLQQRAPAGFVDVVEHHQGLVAKLLVAIITLEVMVIALGSIIYCCLDVVVTDEYDVEDPEEHEGLLSRRRRERDGAAREKARRKRERMQQKYRRKYGYGRGGSINSSDDFF